MAVTLIVLYLANSHMRNQIENFFVKAAEINAWMLFVPLVLFLAIICLCIYHVFTTREKTVFEKRVMVGFAVLTNLATGTIAAVYTLTNAVASDWLLVFPIWNIINGVLMLLMVSLRVIDEECISERKATVVDIILGLAAVLVIFTLCNYVFKLHWAITFSICIVYTTSFDKALQNIFPGPKCGENEQAA
jgi:phosphatidylserine synthase